MAELWFPGAVRDEAPAGCWGRHVDAGEPKFVLHTTEGPAGVYHPDPVRGEGRRYYGNLGTWPNYTLAREDRGRGGWRVFCHIPAGWAGMALRNLPGGVQTNRDNVSQVEIAWSAARIGELPGDALDVLAGLLAWEHRVRGVPLRSTVAWPPYPRSYGASAAQRLSPAAWDAYAGVLGHMHAAENDHGDPGAFPIGALLDRAIAITRGDDDVTEQDKIDIAGKVLAALRTQVLSVSPPIRQGNAGQVIGATYNKTGDLQADVAGLVRQGEALATALAGLREDVARLSAMISPAPPG